jgi:predicted nucleotidyltransferase
VQLTRFLDVVFASAAKVKVLRQLALDSKARSGRALAREIHLSHGQVLRVLRELHGEGIVRLERIGRSSVYSLRHDALAVMEVLVPLFRREQALPEEMARKIVTSVRTPTLSISVFGSVAKGADRAGSDLDMVIVVKGRAERVSVEEELAGDVADRAAALGTTLGPFVITRIDLRRRFRAGDPFVREITTAARHVSGALLMEVISGVGSKPQDPED